MRPPRFRVTKAMCENAHHMLSTAAAMELRNAEVKRAVVEHALRNVRVAPLESMPIKREGNYITLGETVTPHMVIFNPRTRESKVRSLGRATILLPKSDILELDRVARLRANGIRAEMRPSTARVMEHERGHAIMELTGLSDAERTRLTRAWERDPKQLKRDVEVVFGKQRAAGIMKSYPTSQVAGVMLKVNKEKYADEDAIKGEVRRSLKRLKIRAVKNPQQYLNIVEASADRVLEGRPPEYQRAVRADIEMMARRMRGMKFKVPKRSPFETWTDKITQFSQEVVAGFGGMGQHSAIETMRMGGPFSQGMRRF